MRRPTSTMAILANLVASMPICCAGIRKSTCWEAAAERTIVTLKKLHAPVRRLRRRKPELRSGLRDATVLHARGLDA